jgi:hypothetical protein
LGVADAEINEIGRHFGLDDGERRGHGGKYSICYLSLFFHHCLLL